MTTLYRPKCEMVADCTNQVAYIDAKGFVYCGKCAKRRNYYVRCRKLRTKELQAMLEGKLMTKY